MYQKIEIKNKKLKYVFAKKHFVYIKTKNIVHISTFTFHIPCALKAYKHTTANKLRKKNEKEQIEERGMMRNRNKL